MKKFSIMSSDAPKLTRSMSRRFYRFESLAEQLAEVLGRQQSDPNLWVFEVAWEVANKGEFNSARANFTESQVCSRALVFVYQVSF